MAGNDRYYDFVFIIAFFILRLSPDLPTVTQK